MIPPPNTALENGPILIPLGDTMIGVHKAPFAALLVTTLATADVPEVEVEFELGSIESRDGKTYPTELGRIEVPENRSVDGGRTISLAFLRVRSPSENPGPPVFLLAGGPGGSSIHAVRQHVTGGGSFYLDLIGGDIIGIDQRGTGLSRPNLSTDTKFDLSLEEPGDPEEILAVMRAACREEAARFRAKGVDLDGYTTVESADDIEVVRRALGYEKIALWGESYGTHLAMAMIRRHGAHVDRAVMNGPEGPNHTVKLPSSTQHGLELLAEKVRLDPVLGEEIPDLVGLVKTVLDRLEEAPVYVELGDHRVGVSKFDVQRWIANNIGLVRGYAEKVPAMVAWMADEDFEPIAQQLLEERRDSEIGSAMPFLMDSASGMTAARAEQVAREAEETLLSDTVNFPMSHLAEAWGAPDLGDAFRGPLRSDVPVLFLVGDLDSRTPLRNAEELMEHLPNSHLIVVENAGHDVNFVQSGLRDAWSDFLAGREVTMTRVEAPKPKFELP